MRHIRPVVQKKGDGWRGGKGFSHEELEKAGLNPMEVKRMKIPVDKRRTTAYEQNILVVKAFVKKKKAEAKPKKKLHPKKKAKK